MFRDTPRASLSVLDQRGSLAKQARTAFEGYLDALGRGEFDRASQQLQALSDVLESLVDEE